MRVIAGFVAVMGVTAVFLNRRFGQASVDASRDLYGVDLAEGSTRHRFTVGYSRVLAVVIGSAMAVLGVLGALGIIG